MIIGFTHILCSKLSLGTSQETLLGFIVVISSILFVLILLALTHKIFVIPLTTTTGLIFSGITHTVKRNAFISEKDLILDKEFEILNKNSSNSVMGEVMDNEVTGKCLDKRIEFEYTNYLQELTEKNIKYDVSKVNLQDLKEYILSCKDLVNMEEVIVLKIKENIIFIDSNPALNVVDYLTDPLFLVVGVIIVGSVYCLWGLSSNDFNVGDVWNAGDVGDAGMNAATELVTPVQLGLRIAMGEHLPYHLWYGVGKKIIEEARTDSVIDTIVDLLIPDSESTQSTDSSSESRQAATE